MIQEKKISLRAPEPEDVDFLFKMENDKSMWHLSNTLTPFSKFDLEQFVMLSDKDIFTTKQSRFIIDKEGVSGKLPVGAIDLFNFEPQHKRAGIGIMIIKDEQRKGIANIALDLIIDYGFNILGLHQLYCNIEASNKASFGLFVKKGFETIGLKKEWNFRNSGWVDEQMLQLINPI